MFNIISHEEVQIKTTMRYHAIPTGIAIINKTDDSKS